MIQKILLVILFFLFADSSKAGPIDSSDYTKPKACHSHLNTAVLAECKKLKIGNPTYIDVGFGDAKNDEFNITVAGDTPKGLYDVEFKVKVKVSADKKSCSVISIKETVRRPHG